MDDTRSILRRGLYKSQESYAQGRSIVEDTSFVEDDAGDPPKSLKVANTPGEKALEFFYSGVLNGYNNPPDKVLALIGGGDVEKGKQLFVKNFNLLRKAATRGSNKPPRSWMPVIQPNDIPGLIKRLKSGDIDLAIPHAKVQGTSSEVPGGKSKAGPRRRMESVADVFRAMLLEREKQFRAADIDASKGKGQPKPTPDPLTFMKKGKLDGETADDIVQGIKTATIPVGKLKPSQDEIYGSKICLNMAKFGPTVGGKTAFGKPDIIVTSDNYLLDGHHRWATAYVGSPNNKVNVTVIPLPFKHLYLILRAYGAAIGNRQQA